MQPDIILRFTVYDHINAYARLLREAAWQVTQAQTADERLEAMIWQDNAERNLEHWKRKLKEETP